LGLESNLGLNVEIPEWQQCYDTNLQRSKSREEKFSQKDLDLLYRSVIKRLDEAYNNRISIEQTEQLYNQLKEIEKLMINI